MSTVSTYLPDCNRIKLAFPETTELYDRLANTYHNFELRITTHPGITVDQRTHPLPVAELRDLSLVVDFGVILASMPANSPGTKSNA